MTLINVPWNSHTGHRNAVQITQNECLSKSPLSFDNLESGRGESQQIYNNYTTQKWE